MNLSRSVQRRVAAQKGEPAPTFENKAIEESATGGRIHEAVEAIRQLREKRKLAAPVILPDPSTDSVEDV